MRLHRYVSDMPAQTTQIDLRGVGPVVVRPKVGVTVRWLRAVLVDGQEQSQAQLLDTFIGLCDHGVVPAVSGSVRADAWRNVLARLRGLGPSAAFAGAFKIQLDQVVRAGQPLVGADRSVLARLLVARAAVEAPTQRDFRSAVVAARTVDPGVLAPENVVDALVRPFVRSASVPSAMALVSTALATTCAMLESGTGDTISAKDALALRAAIAMLDGTGRASLAPYVARVSGADRATLERLFALDVHRRWWPRGRVLARRS